MQYWLIKTEPNEFSWHQMKQNITTQWTGVRNFEARNYMKKMKLNDLCFFYHTGKEKQIIGLVNVIKTYYPDMEDNKFGVVDVKYYESCKVPLELRKIKTFNELEGMLLIKRPRLSVMPITISEAQFIYNKTGLSGNIICKTL